MGEKHISVSAGRYQCAIHRGIAALWFQRGPRLLSVLHTRLGDRQAGFFCIYLLKTNHILICSDGVWVPSFCASPQTPSPGLSAPGLHLSGLPAAPHRSLPAHTRSLPDRTLPIGPPPSDPV